MVNVGKYIIHGCYGICILWLDIVCIEFVYLYSDGQLLGRHSFFQDMFFLCEKVFLMWSSKMFWVEGTSQNMFSRHVLRTCHVNCRCIRTPCLHHSCSTLNQFMWIPACLHVWCACMIIEEPFYIFYSCFFGIGIIAGFYILHTYIDGPWGTRSTRSFLPVDWQYFNTTLRTAIQGCIKGYPGGVFKCFF